MKISKESVKDVAIATVKGATGLIPIAGGFLSEYIGLANEKVAAKRLNEWIRLVDERLRAIENNVSHVA